MNIRDPYVKDLIHGRTVDAGWGMHHESAFLMILEAHRRFEEETGDSRTAAALTLAWAALEGGRQ